MTMRALNALICMGCGYSGTTGGVGEAQGLRDPCAVVASPCGDGTLAARATPQRAPRQRADGGERMPFPLWLPKVGHGSEHGNERTWMCSHQAPPLVRVGAQVGDAEHAEPHGEHNPLSLLGTCDATPI